MEAAVNKGRESNPGDKASTNPNRPQLGMGSPLTTEIPEYRPSEQEAKQQQEVNQC
jgi:hypothetical protein